jgi:two-component system CheB/CheR fusion protein
MDARHLVEAHGGTIRAESAGKGKGATFSVMPPLMLSSRGARVRVAASASEAITAIEDFRPEVLLCDIAMPGEDGYSSLIRKVRALGKARGGGDIPAVALTALAGEENRRLALSAGFQIHLTKPVDMDRLTRAVAELSSRTTSVYP